MKISRKKTAIQIASIAAFFCIIVPTPLNAFSFTKNFIISDQEMENSNGLSLNGIESFLQENDSVLYEYETNDVDGTTRTVANIIWRVSKKYALSPMLFLVMAQKESSAITKSTLTYAIENWILGYGRCDSCSESDAAAYRGIAQQFHSAADKIRNGYLKDLSERGYTISGWGPGITKTTTDGIVVTPQNDATAALYTYNPCVGVYGGGYEKYGCNSAFQKLWQEWNPPAKYPDGTLIQVGDIVYLIQKGKKRAFTSHGALVTNYNLDEIIYVSAVVGDQYEDGSNIHFPNYSLLRNPAGTVYLLVDEKKRGFASQEVMRELGINPEEILDVRWGEIDPIPEGKKITSKILYVRGALFQNKDTGAIFSVDSSSMLHPIWSKEVLENRFPNKPVELKSQEEIDLYTEGKPLKLEDGTLVTSKKAKSVYIISNGKKRPFKSKKVFDAFGYRWNNVLTVPHTVLELHATGTYVTLK